MGLPSRCDVIDGFNRISQVYCAPDVFFYDSIADSFGHDDFIVQESPYGALAAQEIMALVLAVMEANAYLPYDGAVLDSAIGTPDELGLLPSQIHLVSTQANLDRCQSTPRLSHVLALNVILTKFWLKLVVWNSGCLRLLLLELVPQLLWKYATTIAYDLLTTTRAFPPMVFESNGPGVVVKLLGIANGVANSIAYIQDPSVAGQSTSRPEDNYRMFNALYSLFSLVTTFKTAIKLPAGLYHKIERIVLSQPIPRLIAYHHRPSLGSDLLVTPTVSPIPPIFRPQTDQQPVNPYPSIREELESYTFERDPAANVTYL